MSESSTFDIRVYFTITTGTNVELLSPIDAGEEFAERANEIAKHYAEVLSLLFGGLSDLPGIERLQFAFTAACGGLSREEWQVLSKEEKNAQRAKYCSFLRPTQTSEDRKPPALVIYLGGARTIPASPSYKLQNSLQHNRTVVPWENEWEEASCTAELPCEWGWHVRNDGSAYGGASLIMLSGAFVVWPYLWRADAQSSLSKWSHRTENLNVFLKVVIFHELVHAIRSLVHGPAVVTPEKCIDDPKWKRGAKGEAGRLAERLAFGRVVNLHMKDLHVTLFACNDDQDRTPYEISDVDRASLFNFNVAEAPLSPQKLLTFKPCPDIPFSERSKSLVHEEKTVHVTSRPENESSCVHFIAVNNHSLRRITGPLAAEMVALASSRGSCVEMAGP